MLVATTTSGYWIIHSTDGKRGLIFFVTMWILEYNPSPLGWIIVFRIITITVAQNDVSDVKNSTTTSTAATPPLSLPPTTPSSQSTEGNGIYDLAVLLPADSSYEFSLQHVLPAIALATQEISIPNIEFRIRNYDTKCDAQSGPIAAVDLMINRTVDVFLGPVCPYSCAPIARFTRHWGKPLITAGAEADPFADKNQYYITRTGIVYDKLAKAVAGIILDTFGWKQYNVLLFDRPYDIYNHDCSFQTSAIHKEVMRRLHLDNFNDTVEFHSFGEKQGPPYKELVDLLELIQKKARGKWN